MQRRQSGDWRSQAFGYNLVGADVAQGVTEEGEGLGDG